MELKTSDGVKLSAAYFKSESGTRDAVILLHMLGRNKSDYFEFAKRLQPNYDVLAIDFRGHGDSAGDLSSFSPADFSKFKLDVKAARDFLGREGKKIYAIIGASIGANTALNYASGNDIDRLVLLSPGLDFRGVTTEDSARRYLGAAFLAASEDDSYSASSARKLYDMMLGKKQIKIYQNAGHGTKMFASTDLEELILGWLKTN